MEVYRNTQANATLEVPSSAISTLATASNKIVAIENGREVYEFPVIITTATGFSVDLPWNLVTHDRNFTVNWNFSYSLNGIPSIYQDRTYVEVVTPLLSLTEVSNIAGNILPTEAADLERRVRYVIQSYTGQNFGRFFGTMRVSGNGGSKLQLPAPLLEFSSLSYDGVLRSNHGVSLNSDGWSLSAGNIYIDSIKQAPPEWMLDRFDYAGKIHAPMLYGQNSFIDGVEYAVTGVWGYGDVPADVRAAARLLVSDYSCDESLYRDKYLEVISASDWRFQFNSGAYVGTGNVQADQILDKYRRATMVVI